MLLMPAQAPNPLPRRPAPAVVSIRADGHEPHRAGARVKPKVALVFHGNGITPLLQGRTRLIGSAALSDIGRDELLQLCRLRLDALRASGQCTGSADTPVRRC